MTPFDPVALLAMLLTFYPVCSPAELVRARRERPEYFAGGVIGPGKGDDLLLPDGRCFDLIFAAGNTEPGVTHWQVIVCGDGDETPSPWPLEPGPLTPIDGGRFPPPTYDPIFEPLMAGAIGDLADPDTALHLVVVTITGASSPEDLEASYAATIAGIDAVVIDQHNRLNGIDPSDVILNHDALGATIDIHDHDYDEPLPPDPPTMDPPGPPPENPQPTPDNPI